MIGKRVGPYEIVEEIGHGGMATVFRAYQPNVGRFVAVKAIHRSIAGDARALERFQREAKLVARLEHPHLLPIYDYDATHEPPYIVMRYLESGTLKDILDQGPLPLNEVAFIMRQITSALDYAHRQGVIHRDIKPSNVMVDQDGNAYLMDFGIARMMEGGQQGLTMTGMAVGTPGYMSPEQGMGIGTIDLTADIYSLGVMLFQMVTGHLPYTAETPMGVILKHMNAPVPSAQAVNPSLPATLDEVIAKAMGKRPEDRYQSATEVSEQLTKAVGTTSGPLRPVVLRRAAQTIIERMRQERAALQPDFDATMATFEQERAASSTRAKATQPSPPPTPVPVTPPAVGSATFVPPVQRDASTSNVPVPPRARGTSMLTWIAAGVVLLLVGAIAVVLISRGGGGASPTATVTTTQSADQPSLTPPGVIVVETEATAQGANTAVLPPTVPGTLTDAPTLTLTSEPAATTADVVVVPTNTDVPPSATNAPPTDTTTPDVPIVRAERDLTVRLGPGSDFPAVATLTADDTLTIIGLSEDGGWYQVALPDGTTAWVSSAPAVVSAAGNLRGVPLAAAPTDLPTEMPTITPTDTNTPTDLPTATPTFTDTPTETDVPTNTDVPTDTNVPPTDTPTLTAAPSETATTAPTEVVPPTEVPAELPTDVPSITGAPFPYLDNFGSGALTGWIFDPLIWQIVPDEGNLVLSGQALLTQPITILGQESPAWRNEPDIAVSYRFNLDPFSAGARLVFRATDSGYDVLEVLPGLMSLRRSSGPPSVGNRNAEQVLLSQRAPVEANRWHNLTLWAQGTRIFVYIDHTLVMIADDLTNAQPGGGDILLQGNSNTAPVRFDDIRIQKPEAPSSHFDEGIPTSWLLDEPAATLGREVDGNQFLQLQDESVARPDLGSMGDIDFAYRAAVDAGGYLLRVRHADESSLLLDFTGGLLTVSHVDPQDTIIQLFPGAPAYEIGRWTDIHITLVGESLRVTSNGAVVFDQVIPGAPASGTIAFLTRGGDLLRLDDVLIADRTAAAPATAELPVEAPPVEAGDDSTVAYALNDETMARPFDMGRSDLQDDFSNIELTSAWWLGGTAAGGELIEDLSDTTEHSRFLRLTATDSPVYRIIRDVIGVELFRIGSDTETFSNSTDVLASVMVRFPTATPGIAWITARATLNANGTVDGYRLGLLRDEGGALYAFALTPGATMDEALYQDVVVDSADGWTHLKIITLRNRVYFFVNNQLVVSADAPQVLGGTVALGVQSGTTADFDTLVIRDTTPVVVP